jgi:D-proline reductase (dithiol) PrdB
VGLVCRVAEAAGITTVCLSTGRDLTAQVMPPRSLFVNFPMGNAFGKPFDREMQKAILRALLTLAEQATTPGELVDLPYVWPEPFEFNPGASRM